MHQLRHCIIPCRFSLEIRGSSEQKFFPKAVKANKWPYTEYYSPPSLLHAVPTAMKERPRVSQARISGGKDLTDHFPKCRLLHARKLRHREIRGLAGPRLTGRLEADLEHHFDHQVPKPVPFHIFMIFQSGDLKEADSFRILGNLLGLFFFFLFLLDIEISFIYLFEQMQRKAWQLT